MDIRVATGIDVRFISSGGVEDHPVEGLQALLDRDDGVVWVDIPVCNEPAASVLSEVFGFHPLAIRNCVERNAVPKVRAYRDHLFVVLHAPELGKSGHVHYVELDQFIGPRFLVTVHGPVNPAVKPEVALDQTRAVLRRIETGQLSPSSGFELSHAIVSKLAQRRRSWRPSPGTCGRWNSGSQAAIWVTPRPSSRSCSAPVMRCWRSRTWPRWVTRSTGGWQD
jgi:magnesium transporter